MKTFVNGRHNLDAMNNVICKMTEWYLKWNLSIENAS